MSKYFHTFPVDVVQIDKDQIVQIATVDKKAYVGDFLLTYEDGSKELLTREQAHAQLVDGEKGHIEDKAHVVTLADLALNPEMGLTHGQVILLPYEIEVKEKPVKFTAAPPEEVK